MWWVWFPSERKRFSSAPLWYVFVSYKMEECMNVCMALLFYLWKWSQVLGVVHYTKLRGFFTSFLQKQLEAGSTNKPKNISGISRYWHKVEGEAHLLLLLTPYYVYWMLNVVVELDLHFQVTLFVLLLQFNYYPFIFPWKYNNRNKVKCSHHIIIVYFLSLSLVCLLKPGAIMLMCHDREESAHSLCQKSVVVKATGKKCTSPQYDYIYMIWIL